MTGGDQGSHPSPAELDRFLMGQMSPREAAPVVAHLLAGCDLCKERMAPLAGVIFSPGEPPEPAVLTDGAEYDFPLFRAFATARRYAESLERERQEPERHAGSPLKEVPPPSPVSFDQRASRDWTQCEAFLERCQALRHSDPEGLVMLAGMAVTLAERISPGRLHGEEAVADLQARAWAELGNARRVSDDLPGAEADLARALDRAGRGTGDPRLLARIMDLTASLLTDQRRFREAFQLLDWVHAIYLSRGETHAAGRALISKGISAGYALDAEEAVRLLAQGLRLIDARRDPQLVLAGVHSLSLFLVDCGRLEEARRLLSCSRPLYARHGERLDQLKARWVEGLVATELKDDRDAEQALLEVRAGFAETELAYDTALVSLDLAAVWLRNGRTAEIKALLDETVAVFRARKIRREAIGALLMLRAAFEQEGATIALLRNVASELQRLEREPAARPGNR
ncbi:MAG TPA: hypothetical protein VF756_25330 [Thermoanaerobaculia bacterium]